MCLHESDVTERLWLHSHATPYACHCIEIERRVENEANDKSCWDDEASFKKFQQNGVQRASRLVNTSTHWEGATPTQEDWSSCAWDLPPHAFPHPHIPHPRPLPLYIIWYLSISFNKLINIGKCFPEFCEVLANYWILWVRGHRNLQVEQKQE